jgi:phosphohistidine phosphatase SixA
MVRITPQELHDLAQMSRQELAERDNRLVKLSGVELLVLVRHGEYEPRRGLAGGALTARGASAVEGLAFELKHFLPLLSRPAVHCSMANRAIESATIICREIGALPPSPTLLLGDEKGNQPRDWSVDSVIRDLAEASRNRTTLVLVGHLPALRALASWVSEALDMEQPDFLRGGLQEARAAVFNIGAARVDELSG